MTACMSAAGSAEKYPWFDASVTSVVTACVVFASPVHAQEKSSLARVEAFGLDTATVGRVITYFAPGDRDRAEQLASLAEQIAVFYERELGLSFERSGSGWSSCRRRLRRDCW